MNTLSPTIAIIGSNSYETKTAKAALSHMYNIHGFTIKDSIVAFMESIDNFKKIPAVIFISMKITAGDSLLATTILKAAFPKVKIILYASNANKKQIQNYLAEGASAFLATDTLEACNSYTSQAKYAIENLQLIMHTIINSNTQFIDPHFKILNVNLEKVITTQKIVQKHFSNYSPQQILIMQLNVLGIKQENMVGLVHVSKPTISRYFKKLEQDFGVATPKDLALATICNGIVKIVMIHEDFEESIV